MACGIARTVLREHVRCVNGPLSLFATLRFKCCPTSVRPSMRMWHSVRLMLCCRVRKAWPITQCALVQTNWVSRYIFVVFRRSTKQISSSELAIFLGVQIFRNVWTPVVLTTLFWGTFVKSLLTAAPLCWSKTVSGKLYEGKMGHFSRKRAVFILAPSRCNFLKIFRAFTELPLWTRTCRWMRFKWLVRVVQSLHNMISFWSGAALVCSKWAQLRLLRHSNTVRLCQSW